MKQFMVFLIGLLLITSCDEEKLVDPYDESEQITVTMSPDPLPVRQVGTTFRTDDVTIKLSDAENVLWYYSYDINYKLMDGTVFAAAKDVNLTSSQGVGAGRSITTYFGVFPNFIKTVEEAGYTSFQAEYRFICARTERYTQPVTLTFTIVK